MGKVRPRKAAAAKLPPWSWVPEKLKHLKKDAIVHARQLAAAAGYAARQNRDPKQPGNHGVNEVAAELLEKDLRERFIELFGKRNGPKLLPPSRRHCKDLCRIWWRKLHGPGSKRALPTDAHRSGRPCKLTPELAEFLRDRIDQARPDSVRTCKTIFQTDFWCQVRNGVGMKDGSMWNALTRLHPDIKKRKTIEFKRPLSNEVQAERAQMAAWWLYKATLPGKGTKYTGPPFDPLPATLLGELGELDEVEPGEYRPLHIPRTPGDLDLSYLRR